MTIQCGEIIIYNGKETSMYSWPDLPESHSRIKVLSDEEIKAADVNSVISTSRCWREYVGTWEVKDGRLYLVHLNGRYSLNGDDPLFADWFSGIVEIPDGEARSGLLHDVRRIFEKEIHVKIENGVVTKTSVIDNRGKEGTRFSEDDEKHYSLKDTTPSLTDIRKAAEQGDAEAQKRLGDMYYAGNGVPQNEAESVKWFRKAADQGHADAQKSLGRAYEHGSGVPLDEAESMKWYRKAALQGNRDAQFYLGLSFFYGEGVEEDKAEAVRWYCKAAVKGDSDAQKELGDCYLNGEGVEEDKAEAVKWYRKAADDGNKPAQISLGDCYFSGKGVELDQAEALKWYKKSLDSFKLVDESEWEYEWLHNGDISVKNCSDKYLEGPLILEVTIDEINFYKILWGPHLIGPGEEYIFEGAIRADESDIYMAAQLYRPFGRYVYERETLH